MLAQARCLGDGRYRCFGHVQKKDSGYTGRRKAAVNWFAHVVNKDVVMMHMQLHIYHKNPFITGA